MADESDTESERNWNKVARMEIGAPCLNVVSMVVFVVAFLVGQTILLVSWSFVCSRRRKNSLVESEMIYGSSNWSTRSSALSGPAVSKSFPPYSDCSMLYSVPSRQSASYIYS